MVRNTDPRYNGRILDAPFQTVQTLRGPPHRNNWETLGVILTHPKMRGYGEIAAQELYDVRKPENKQNKTRLKIGRENDNVLFRPRPSARTEEENKRHMPRRDARESDQMRHRYAEQPQSSTGLTNSPQGIPHSSARTQPQHFLPTFTWGDCWIRGCCSRGKGFPVGIAENEVRIEKSFAPIQKKGTALTRHTPQGDKIRPMSENEFARQQGMERGHE